MYPNQPPQNPYPPQNPTPPQGPDPQGQAGQSGQQWQQPQTQNNPYPYGQPVTQPQQQWQQQPTPQPQQWQPQPAQPDFPVDYLNQIAPKTQKKSLFSSFGIKQVLAIGGALIVLVLILVGIANSIGGGNTDRLKHLSVRMTNTQKVASDSQQNLKSSQLRSLNASLNLYFTNTNRDLAAPFAALDITTKSIGKDIAADESTEQLSSRLEDARLNAVFDRTYAREMAYQLGNTLTLMEEIYNNSNNDALKSTIETAYNNLQPIQKSFANFTTTD